MNDLPLRRLLRARAEIRISIYNISSVFIICLSALASCSAEKTSGSPPEITEGLEYYLVGEINNEHYLNLREYDGLRLTVYVNSTGGGVGDALNVAELALSNEWNIKIIGLCFSSCIEILALGFERIEILPGGVVGFHGNSRFKNFLYKTAIDDVTSKCFLQFEKRRNVLYRTRGINPEFWRRQITELKPFDVRILGNTDEPCPSISYRLVHDLWIPSTDVIENGYGLAIIGSQSTEDLTFKVEFSASMQRFYKSMKID